MSELKTALQSLFAGKPSDFQDTVNNVLLSKVSDQINIMQKTMASSWLNNDETAVENAPEPTEAENAEV